MIRNSHTSMDYISPSYSTNTKINKTTTQPRKGNNLRLSLRRFSHHGAGTANRQSTRNETGIYNSTIPILDLEIYPWSRCQEEILKLAQGEKLDSKERTKLAVSIRNITYGSRNLAELILTDLFVASSIQEAFKQLATNFDQNSSLELDGISKLWIQFYDTILPTLHSVLYPFEESTSCNIRKAILTAFRDGVVLDPDLSYDRYLSPPLHRSLHSSESVSSTFLDRRSSLIIEQYFKMFMKLAIFFVFSATIVSAMDEITTAEQGAAEIEKAQKNRPEGSDQECWIRSTAKELGNRFIAGGKAGIEALKKIKQTIEEHPATPHVLVGAASICVNLMTQPLIEAIVNVAKEGRLAKNNN